MYMCTHRILIFANKKSQWRLYLIDFPHLHIHKKIYIKLYKKLIYVYRQCVCVGCLYDFWSIEFGRGLSTILYVCKLSLSFLIKSVWKSIENENNNKKTVRCNKWVLRESVIFNNGFFKIKIIHDRTTAIRPGIIKKKRPI